MVSSFGFFCKIERNVVKYLVSGVFEPEFEFRSFHTIRFSLSLAPSFHCIIPCAVPCSVLGWIRREMERGGGIHTNNHLH